MCDYSLELVASRAAKVGDRLVTTQFKHTITRGFAEIGKPDVAVCVLPGTELAFERDVEYDHFLGFFPRRQLHERVARFRQVNMNDLSKHHDALEFPSGEVVLLHRLFEGQRATVLQLPAMGAPERAEGKMDGSERSAGGSPWRMGEAFRA
jgi:hypothetical protein